MQSHRTPMNQKELKELIEFLIEKDVTEFELERGDVKVKIKRGQEHVAHSLVAMPAVQTIPVATAHAPVAATAAPSAQGSSAPANPAAQEDDVHIVKSPIVGTFYEAPSPGAPPFVKIGDTVEAGQVLCIVEAMKLLNEIEADVSGEIARKMANNGQPIEYGQELFAIKPK